MARKDKVDPEKVRRVSDELRAMFDSAPVSDRILSVLDQMNPDDQEPDHEHPVAPPGPPKRPQAG